MNTKEAFWILETFTQNKDAQIIEAIDLLAEQNQQGLFSEADSTRFSQKLMEIKWSYPGVHTSTDETPRYLKTHPGFLADVLLWAGWEFVKQDRARDKAAL